VSPKVLLEDDWLLAIDKPSGMAVHSGAGLHEPTVNDWARDYLGTRTVRNGFEASVVHRLDRETSGVLLVAKRRPAMRALSAAFENRAVEKQYLALVRGELTASGAIERPLADENGRDRAASTRWESVESLRRASLLRALPQTGRKHQIRLHLASVGHPIAGDTTHGDATFNTVIAQAGLTRLFLHAALLRFPHPQDGRLTQVEAPLPADLAAVLTRLR
jgi:23S rRNA pseudouridine955/2504/2580 synthase